MSDPTNTETEAPAEEALPTEGEAAVTQPAPEGVPSSPATPESDADPANPNPDPDTAPAVTEPETQPPAPEPPQPEPTPAVMGAPPVGSGAPGLMAAPIEEEANPKDQEAEDFAEGIETIGGKRWRVLGEVGQGLVIATRAVDGLPAPIYCVQRDEG